MMRSREIDPCFVPIAEAFASLPGVTAGWMMSSYGLKIRGKVFAFSGRGRFVAKLPRERVEALMAEGRGVHFDPGHGRPMKEWIALDGHEEMWLELAREAYQYVQSQKG